MACRLPQAERSGPRSSCSSPPAEWARPKRERGSAAAGYVFVLSVLGLAAVFYYGYASFVVLQKMCVLCMTMYVAVVGIFIVSSSATSIAMASLPGRLLRDIRAVFMGPVAAGLAILWLVGSVSLIAFFPREGVQAAAQEVSAPLETLDAAQLAEWHSWLDKQPRVPEMLPTGNVKVVFIKFNDYQCPSCRMTWAAYRDVIAKWEADRPGVFSFQTRDFPLEVECGSGNAGHSGACESAVAVRLARARNHGPEMEAWLYEHQDELTRDRVKEKVREIAGVEDYDAQYPTVLAKVREDAQLGTKLGVTGTPTFFLNGIKMGNVRPAYLDAAIAYELQKAS